MHWEEKCRLCSQKSCLLERTRSSGMRQVLQAVSTSTECRPETSSKRENCFCSGDELDAQDVKATRDFSSSLNQKQKEGNP